MSSDPPSTRAGRQYLSAADVAEQFDVPIATVRYWRTIAYGPRPIKLGRHLRYLAADWVAFVDELKASSSGSVPPAAARKPSEVLPLRIEDLAECPICLAVLRVGHLRRHEEWHGTRP